jgi:entericidin B
MVELEIVFRLPKFVLENSAVARRQLTGRNIMAKRIATTVLSLLILLGAISALSACNTMEGAGKDVQHGGRALEDSADRNK